MTTSSAASTTPTIPLNGSPHPILQPTEFQYLALVQQYDGTGEPQILRTAVHSLAGAQQCMDALLEEIRRLARLDEVAPDETVVRIDGGWIDRDVGTIFHVVKAQRVSGEALVAQLVVKLRDSLREEP